jgi:asparagine synthase (glutamine-hydrolysing)
MAGLAGWAFVDGFGFDAERAVDRMGHALSRFDAAPIVTRSSPRWHVSVCGFAGAPSIAQSDRWTVAIHGAPELKGPASRQDGVARAVLERFEKEGVSLLPSLSGAFSLGVVSADGRSVVLAVDKLGIEPLYYAVTEHGVVFSSKLAAVVAHPSVRSSIRSQSIYDYLYSHVIPRPHTIYNEVRCLEPGCCVEIRGGEATHSRRYWQITFENERGPRADERKREEFREVARSSVAHAMGGSNAYGCFLSGGTDSSTVAGMVGAVSGGAPRTYSIGFDVEGFDEMSYARLAAKHFGADHHEYYVSPADVVELIPKIGSAYGQPFGNASVVGAFACARMARNDGVRTLLAGDGGDELFGGNERYATQQVFELYKLLPRPLRRHLLEPIVERLPNSDRFWLLYKLKRYVEQAREPMPDRLETYNILHRLGVDVVFDADFLRTIDSSAPLSFRRETYEHVRADTMVNRMLGLDLKFTLADNDLPKVKGMCELAQVSAEFPLLSDEMVSLSASLPVRDKVRGRSLRPFFKDALRGFLPAEIINKPKHGFGLPVGSWILADGRLGDLTGDLLARLKRRKILDTTFIDRLSNQLLPEHPKYYGAFVWVFVVLESWMGEREQATEFRSGP